MIDVILAQFNNSYVKVVCEPSIGQELSEFFTFDVPDAKFSPAFRNRYWDGKIRLFSTKTQQIYAGLVPHIVEFCKLHGYSYENKTNYFGPAHFSPDIFKDLELPVEPRDYQQLAVSYAATRKRVVIISPTASGKSLVAYMIARHMQEFKEHGLLVVPTVSLVEQMYKDFQAYGWDVEKYCQKIYAGQDKVTNKFLTISTWQSLYDLPKKYFTTFDFIIGDEAHTFQAKSLTQIMTKLTNCDYRIGMTGTLNDAKVNKLVLEGLFGPVKKVISTKELIDRGQLADFSIKAIVLQYPEEISKEMRNKSYQEEIDFLVANEARNNFIKNLALNLKGNTLILFNYVEKHGKVLHAMIEEQAAEGRKVFFVHGDVDVTDRELVRAITETEQDAIIVASYGTFSTGINIRNLHNIIFASPTKSKIRTLQSIGRGLRLGDNKEKAVLYDIADDMRYKDKVNYTLRHFEERVKFYSEERFKFTTNTIRISQ